MNALGKPVSTAASVVTSAAPRIPRISVVIPCHDEVASVEAVVAGFRHSLPQAEIIVVDNASSDGTAQAAHNAGARVVHESRLGKGFALLSGFAEAGDSDYCVMVDGDGTYPAAAASALVQTAIDHGVDVVVGTRLDSSQPGAFRRGHSLGNRLFAWLVRVLFGIHTRDLFSGYRVLSRRFLDITPLIATRFEVEAELSVQAKVNGFRVIEVPVEYRPRGERSESKLRTFSDGYHILLAITVLFRDYRPMTFFGALTVFFAIASLASGFLPVKEFLQTGYVNHLPRAVLAAGLFILAALALAIGVLLSSINRRSVELAALIRKVSR